MGDDSCAPNIKRFEYSSEMFSEEELCKCITSYFTSNLPRFEWHGFSNGEFIVCVKCSGINENYHVQIELSDNWSEITNKVRTIFFDHHNDEDFKFGIEQSKYYSQKKAKKVFEKYYGRR